VSSLEVAAASRLKPPLEISSSERDQRLILRSFSPYPTTMAPSVAVRPVQDGKIEPSNNTHPIWWKDAGLRKLNLHLLILLLGSYTW
jgi:hypothetical protein